MDNTDKPTDTAKLKKVLWSLPDFKLTAEELAEIRKAFDYTNEVEGHKIFTLYKFIPILSKVSNVLQNEGFDVADITAENYKIILESSRFEYHVYRNDKKDILKSVFDIHRDSDEGKLHTLIYYPVMTFPYGGHLFVRNTGQHKNYKSNKVSKDKDNKNGKNEVEDKVGEGIKNEKNIKDIEDKHSKTEYAKQFYDEPDTTTLYDIEDGEDNFIPFKAENCICLNGTTDHYVQDMSGGGIRESIVFSIVTKKEHQLDLADRIW